MQGVNPSAEWLKGEIPLQFALVCLFFRQKRDKYSFLEIILSPTEKIGWVVQGSFQLAYSDSQGMALEVMLHVYLWGFVHTHGMWGLYNAVRLHAKIDGNYLS